MSSGFKKASKCKDYLMRMQEYPPLDLSMLPQLPRNELENRKKKVIGKEASQVLLPGKSKWSLTPFYLKVPKEPYYEGHSVARRYHELSLLKLQRAMDLGRFANRRTPIDLAAICNAGFFKPKLDDHNFCGIILTDDGSNCFKARVDIEVQKVLNESCIAAIERNGGSITCRYYDRNSLEAMFNAEAWFTAGKPIPMCGLPPLSLFEYYTNPDSRGYLSNPADLDNSKVALAQKFGYEFPEAKQDGVLTKDPRQIFFGLEPGWLVNLTRRQIYRPTNPKHVEYYHS